MHKIINEITQKHFNTEPSSIEQVLDKGKVNQVFKVVVSGTPYIFRINKKDYINTYQKEFFCIKKATEVKIPTSKAYFVGVEDENSYMILDYIEGINGADLDENQYHDIYTKLGEYTRTFNGIKTNGFGKWLNESQTDFKNTWKEVVDDLIQELFGTSFLIEKTVLTLEQFETLESRLEEMYQWEFEPSLCHGNLGIKNTIISPGSTIHIIDWGNGAGHRAPHFELAELLTWKTTTKYIEDFISGYGLSTEEFHDMIHDINTLICVRLLTSINWAIKEDKHLKDKDFVAGSVERMLNLD